MYTTEIKIRVRYGETDQMGYVYYGNYAAYFEVARIDSLRQLEVSYKNLEKDGIMLPVFSYSVKFLKPAFFDSQLTIKTIIRELPLVRIKFEYETYDEKSVLLNTAETTLVFIDKKKNRPCVAPGSLIEKLKKHFD